MFMLLMWLYSCVCYINMRSCGSWESWASIFAYKACINLLNSLRPRGISCWRSNSEDHQSLAFYGTAAAKREAYEILSLVVHCWWVVFIMCEFHAKSYANCRGNIRLMILVLALKNGSNIAKCIVVKWKQFYVQTWSTSKRLLWNIRPEFD